MGMAQEIQRDYCIRRYTGHAPREDMVKVTFQAPDAKAGYDFFVYKAGDDVSAFIRQDGSYEGDLLMELKHGMEKASEMFGVAQPDVFFMDIGGNIGTHTVYLGSLGYHGLSFEPMLATKI